MNKQEMALKSAVDAAIRNMGLAAFKRTSFFLSNHVVVTDERKAA